MFAVEITIKQTGGDSKGPSRKLSKRRTLLARSPQKIRQSARIRSKMPSSDLPGRHYSILPDELAVLVMEGSSRMPKEDHRHKYLSIDGWFNYPDLKLYHGPSNISHIARFCQLIKIFVQEHYPIKAICIVIKQANLQSLNALLLCASYLVLIKGFPPKRALLVIKPILETLPVSTFKTEGDPLKDDVSITILNCLKGLLFFIGLGLLRMEELDCHEYQLLEQPCNGDMNWIIPGRIVAMAGPTEEVYPIEEFIEYAKRNNIRAVVRLNRTHYPAERLEEAGISHHEMFINDGHIPSLEQIRHFYQIADGVYSEGGALAVHCRAGLGRTGTMIATFLIRKYDAIAADVIAYLRMMRPGSVLGMQARFLESVQYLLCDRPPPKAALNYLSACYPGVLFKMESADGSLSLHVFDESDNLEGEDDFVESSNDQDNPEDNDEKMDIADMGIKTNTSNPGGCKPQTRLVRDSPLIKQNMSFALI